ncbi:hypothetical protein B0J13DRAFT_530626 [Dactylonectria estremocensis]|uniref:F-box domain-containing protein n=1 Tax=Dactylonectria estremocensis TaxID=1079267 RepID=A0A9P9DZ64_9HYPO|nr:hypothetical protein B0J13DRAFT_530626 [Dactylonectria estremocensis]
MCFYAIRGWFRRVKRYWVTKRRDPRGKLEKIPHELVTQIGSQLTDASRLSFALTCRPIFDTFFNEDKQPRLATRKDREEFLQLLEKDVANLYFCYDCAVLHPWTYRFGVTYPLFVNRACANSYRHEILLHGYEHLMFYPARLFINRHLHGPSHGLPLSKLEGRWKSNSPNGVRMQVARRARILDGELFVWVSYTFNDTQGQGGNLRRLFEQTDVSICAHVHTTGGYRFPQGKCVVEGLKRPSLEVPFIPCENTTESCPKCLTDYSFKVIRQSKKLGWTVTIDIFKQLGSCRSPFDWKWRCLSERGGLNEPRSLHYKAGVVRERWAMAEGMEKSEAKFVDLPDREIAFIPGMRRCPWNSYTCHRDDHNCATYGLDD